MSAHMSGCVSQYVRVCQPVYQGASVLLLITGQPACHGVVDSESGCLKVCVKVCQPVCRDVSTRQRTTILTMTTVRASYVLYHNYVTTIWLH